MQTSDRRDGKKTLLQFLLRVVRHFNLGRADVLDCHCGRAVHFHGVAAEVHRAGDMELVFGQFAVRDPSQCALPGAQNKTSRPESRAGGVNYCDPQQINLSAAVKPN